MRGCVAVPQFLTELFHFVLIGGDCQSFPGGKVTVEGADADSSLPGDGFQRGVQASLRKGVDGSGQDGLAVALGVLTFGAGRLGIRHGDLFPLVKRRLLRYSDLHNGGASV